MQTKRPVRIAVVEDDEPIRAMYVLKLKKEGFEVASAEDGQKGFKLIKEFMPALILVDLRMPVMSGQDMLERLRQQDWGKNMLVIVLTNISRDEAPMDLRLLRVERYIIKAHHTPKQVLEIVHETLARHNTKS